MITEFNKNYFFNKSKLIVFSTSDGSKLTNFNFYYNFISLNKTDINIHNLDVNNLFLSIYKNKLHINYDFIGIFTKEFDHHTIYENLNKHTIYIHKSNLYIAINNNLLPLLKADVNIILNYYNKHFNTNYSIKDLNYKPFSMSTNVIYPIYIFEKLCDWLSIYCFDIYYQIVIFNVLQNINIEYLDIQYNLQYYENLPSLDYLYVQNIFEESIKTIFHSDISFDALKTIKINDNIIQQKLCNNRYSVVYNDKEYYNYLDAYDPIPFYFNNKLYIIFSGLTHENNKHRIMYLTDLEMLKPLKSCKIIEKNWIPFTHNNCLYFIISFDNLTYYDYTNNVYITKNSKYSNYFPKGNLILYNNNYIGLCYNKKYENDIKYQGVFLYFIDCITLEITKISKQLLFQYCSNLHYPKVKCFNHNTTLITINNIIVNTNSTFYKNKLINSIVPLYIYNDNKKIYIIVNIQQCLSFIYELRFS